MGNARVREVAAVKALTIIIGNTVLTRYNLLVWSLTEVKNVI